VALPDAWIIATIEQGHDLDDIAREAALLWRWYTDHSASRDAANAATSIMKKT
jgi:hypothetical protein